MKKGECGFIIPCSFMILCILFFTLNQGIKAQSETSGREYIVRGRVFLEDGKPVTSERVILAHCSTKNKCDVMLTANAQDESATTGSPFGHTNEEGLFEIKFDPDFITETIGKYKFLSLGIIYNTELVRLKKDELPVLFILDQFDADNMLDLEELVFAPR
jgi:hypothetical protein